MSDVPSPDQISGAAHPREAHDLLGQDAAQASFLKAVATDHLHHAWLLTGQRGIGKATLAWKIARFLIATRLDRSDDIFDAPPASASLDIPADHPVNARILAGSEPCLLSVTRSVNEKTNRLRADIVVDDVRRLAGFFQMSAADGGHRVVIVDAADDMNVNAANALLKMLEEPPKNATLLLISHQPSRLLPTIRSRCRTLRLNPLNADDMAAALAQAGLETGRQTEALAELSGGSVGDAIRLSVLGGLDLYAEIISLLGSLPRLDQPRALKLAESVTGQKAEDRLDLLYTLLDIALTRLARTGAGLPPVIDAAQDEGQIFSKLATSSTSARAWAATSQTALARARHGRAVNLDPAALVLDTLFKLRETAT